jgi:hypothetical protein
MPHVLCVRGVQTHQTVRSVYLIARPVLSRTSGPRQAVRSVLKTQHRQKHRLLYLLARASRGMRHQGVVPDKLAQRALQENSRRLVLVFVNIAPISRLRMLLLET